VQYAFGWNDKRTEAEDFAPSFHDASTGGARASKIIKIGPWIFTAMQRIPGSITDRLSTDMAS
jgi:hypothetical protein